MAEKELSAFDKFEQLLKAVIAVPKKEIDRLEAERKKKRNIKA